VTASLAEYDVHQRAQARIAELAASTTCCVAPAVRQDGADGIGAALTRLHGYRTELGAAEADQVRAELGGWQNR
jgi:hypothetical protein